MVAALFLPSCCTVAGQGGEARQARSHGLRGTRRLANAAKAADTIKDGAIQADWSKAEDAIADLLEAGMGLELDYWRARKLSCKDIVATIKLRYKPTHDTIKTVLILNNTWHFLNPDGHPYGPGKEANFEEAAKQAKHEWPDLVPAPIIGCPECHGYFRSLHDQVSRAMFKKGVRHGGDAYVLPDALLVINVDDNTGRRGGTTACGTGPCPAAPLLSIQKWWSRPWWPGGHNASTSLGRIDGRLLSDTAFGSMPGADYVPLHAEAASRELPRAAAGEQRWQAVVRHLLQRPLSPLVASGGPVAADAPLLEATDMDILIPQMLDVPDRLYFMDWKDKEDIAFFSGTPFCTRYSDTHKSTVCLREYMAVLSLFFPKDLRVRMTFGVSEPLGTLPHLKSVIVNYTAFERTTTRDHAHYRYLLQLDGFTGSYRINYLMSLNSALLKSRSPYIEWFSRLQVPGAHYLEFWKDPDDPNDVLKAVSEARHAAQHDFEAVQRAISANQQIAARYLGLAPRLAYFRAAVSAYRGLFPDMDECIADLRKHLDLTGRPLHMP